ncbi:PA2778 family cysteine peptidase [Alcanivorax sp. JB21]|uniref:PA2778 family cysteine peptidase n=1 Tax=Alcanivorax limicola TaxID=2874102 RepID=UPI001CBF04F2|nr:PA2778 family cysteine peptidase [Alcanivorax limicola]MBZ2188420.1 PA2778 family cysteine peptidase [Alcanivorax limicola]
MISVARTAARTACARTVCLLVLALLLGACASRTPLTDDLSRHGFSEHGSAENGSAGPSVIELTDVPFHPQRRYQCGPAALATVLEYAGHPADVAQLRDRVYVPARRGSLQPEMRAAVRDYGLLPLAHPADMRMLASNLAQGYPVLVMQNLGFERLPIWHYAVVVGIDLEAGNVILRSGTQQRETLSLKRFERSWARAAHWGMTLHAPDAVPAHATEQTWLQAAAPFEQTGSPGVAEVAYSAALERWPQSFHAQMGLGNVQYQRGRFDDAEVAFRRATTLDAAHPAGWHNLAWALIRQQRFSDAEAPARQAAAMAADESSRYRSALEALQAQHPSAGNE